MSATRDPRLLVASHISAAFGPPKRVQVPTSRRATNSIQHTVETLKNHAIYASICADYRVGNILLRIVNGGYHLELTLLDSDDEPTRFEFPERILPMPAVVPSHLNQKSAEVLALTCGGNLYRLVYPLEGRQYHETPTKEWCTQHSIYSSVSRPLRGLALVHNERTVVVTLENGALLRMDAQDAQGATQRGTWEERIHYTQHGPQAGVLSKILRPGLSEADQIISIASLPSHPECDLIFTVSRDRTLRAWDGRVGNISWVSMPPLPGLDGDGQRESVLPRASPGPFGPLSPDPRTLLRVIIGESNHNPLDDLRVLVFIPTPFSDEHAGFFILYGFDTRSNKLVLVGEKPCSSQTLGCELRDFQVSQGVLHTVWDTAGRTLYEITQLDIGDWVANSDDEEQPPDLWQEAQYLDDEVLSPTFTDMFHFSNDPQAIKEEIVHAILRPGAFSPYTVQTALEGYCKSLLTMPDPPYKALQEPYEGIVERISGIVGCTVTKVVDPATGAELWENYGTALKRDIEGFLARCRDIERSARWPVALARYEDQIVLLERERTGMLVNQDVPLSLYRRISFRLEDAVTEDGLNPPSEYPILNAAMLLRYRIHLASWKHVEDWLRFFPKNEPEQTYNATLLEMAQEFEVGQLDETMGHAVFQFLGPLEQHADLRAALTKVIHLLKDVGTDVKDEEDEHEGELLDIVPKFERHNIDHHHQWSRSVTASYLTSTLEARYILVSSVLFLLMFLIWRENNDYNDDEVSHVDADIIDEFFALHRSITILKYVGVQVTEGPEGKQLKSGSLTPKNSFRREGTADSLLERLEGMNVGRGSVSLPPDRYNIKVKSIQSLLQALLDPLPDTFSLPYASDHFLRSTRLLASESALVAGDAEVILLERLSGYPAVVLQVADWLPKIGGVCYEVGRMRLQLGDVDEAADHFERVARNFGPLAYPSLLEAAALKAVVPLGLSSLTAYYAHIARLFRDDGSVPYGVHFSKLAIHHAESHESTGGLWRFVFEGQLAQRQFELAYLTLVTMPDQAIRRECVSKLVEVMCVENRVEMLMRFNFVGFAGEVEQALMFKSRNAIPDRRPLYSQVLYGWYIQRGDYRNAAYTMYYRARQLGDHLFTGTRETAQTDQLLGLQLDAYIVAIGALSMLESKDAWISVHVASFSKGGISPMQVLDVFPLEMLKAGSPNVEIVNLADMRREFILCKSRRQLARWESQNDWKMGHLEVISRYAQAGLFEDACVAASAFQEDMTGIFVLLVDQCVRLSLGDHSSLTEHETGWLQAGHIARWEGSDDYKGWRLLLDLLDRHDNLQNGYRYRKTCLERLLALNHVVPPPARLTQFFQEREPEYLIRTYLRYDMVSTALDYTLTLVDEFNTRAFDTKQSLVLTNGKLTSNVSAPDAKAQQQTYLRLPYTLIDAATEAATEEADRAKANKIKKAVEERVQKLSAQSRG